jgi:hypothetical protein
MFDEEDSITSSGGGDEELLYAAGLAARRLRRTSKPTTLVRGKCSGRCQSALLGPMGSVAFTFDPVRSSTEGWTVVQLDRRRQWPTQLFS